jgi:hypothetical protein
MFGEDKNKKNRRIRTVLEARFNILYLFLNGFGEPENDTMKDDYTF